MKDRFEDRLKDALHHLPSPAKAEGLQDIVRFIEENPLEEPTRISFWEFFFAQIAFIRKHIWLMQLLIVLGCWLSVWQLAGKNMFLEALVIGSAIAPLLVLAGISELARSFTYGTMEIELSTRYSFRQLMLARISILGLADVICLSAMILFSATQFSIALFQLILYFCVPFLSTCFGCLWMINRFPGKESRYYCSGWSLCLVLTAGLLAYWVPAVYTTIALGGWAAAFGISLCGVVLEARKLMQHCKTMQPKQMTS